MWCRHLCAYRPDVHERTSAQRRLPARRKFLKQRSSILSKMLACTTSGVPGSIYVEHLHAGFSEGFIEHLSWVSDIGVVGSLWTTQELEKLSFNRHFAVQAHDLSFQSTCPPAMLHLFHDCIKMSFVSAEPEHGTLTRTQGMSIIFVTRAHCQKRKGNTVSKSLTPCVSRMCIPEMSLSLGILAVTRVLWHAHAHTLL